MLVNTDEEYVCKFIFFPNLQNILSLTDEKTDYYVNALFDSINNM